MLDARCQMEMLHARCQIGSASEPFASRDWGFGDSSGELRDLKTRDPILARAM